MTAIELEFSELRKKLTGLATENRSLRATVNELATHLKIAKQEAASRAQESFENGAEAQAGIVNRHLEDATRKLEAATAALVQISNMSYSGFASELATVCLKEIGEIE